MAYKFQMTDAILSGTIAPQNDNAFDLGVAGAEWKDLRFDGTAYAGAYSGSSTLYAAGAATFSSTLAVTGAVSSAAAITAGTSFIIGSADLNEADMEKLDGITNGTAAANKALVADGNVDITGLRNVTGTGAITAGTSFVIGSADLNEADMEKLDGITNGTVAASKAVVVDSNKDANGFRNVDGTGDLTMGTITMSGFSVDADGDVELKSVSGSSTLYAAGAATFSSTVAASGSITAGSSFIIGSADLNETDMEKLDGITDGTGAANKALVLDASRDVDTINALGIASMANNWTNAGRTVADMGILTTVDINGGTADGVVIGGASAAAGTFTTLVAGGNVDLGDATSDTITATGRFDSDLVPSSDSARDLGTSALQWAELHCDAGYIDAITVSGVSALQGVTATSFSGSSTFEAVGNSVLGANLAVSGTVTLGGVADTAIAVGSDSLYFLDADGLMKRDTVADIASGMAGVGLAASSGVFALDLNELSDAAAASGDKLAFVDATDNSSKLETVDDLATLFAGTGLSAASAVMALDLNELSAAAVDVAADSIAIIDNSASDGTRKESIADLVSAMAGAGLTATDGVLSSDASPTPTNHGDANGTLAESMNYSASTFSAARTWTLPASPDAGDVISVKAPSNASVNELTIQRAGSQTIDGESQLVIMSDNGAVDLVYLGSDKWAIK
jgi:hypothetical protein